MTDLLLNPEDTGEIPRPIGEKLIRIDTGEATQNLAEYARVMPPMAAIPRRVFDLDDTVIYMPETIGLAGPQSPPPPLPPAPRPSVPPRYDLADVQPLAPWERVAGVEETAVQEILDIFGASVDGDLHEALPRPATPITFPKPQPKPRGLWKRLTYVPQHRAEASIVWTRLRTAAAVVAVLTVVVLVVTW